MSKCLNCGKETKLFGNRYNKYCNVRCRDLWHTDKNRIVHSLRICKVCSSEFIPKNDRVICCSPACAYQIQLIRRSKKPKTKECPVCSKQFTPYNSLDKFCSASCRIENMKSKRSKRWRPESVKKRMGKDNPGYKHGLSVRGSKQDGTGLRLFHKRRDEYRQEMKEAFGYLFCERCGVTNSKFEAHHIVYRSEKPRHEHLHDKKNILNLCVKCHNWYHIHKNNRNEVVEKRELHLLFGNDVLDKDYKQSV